MTLKRRIDRLESKRGVADSGPTIVFFRAGGGEVKLAQFMGGGGAIRLDGETESDFIARVDEMMACRGRE